MFTEDSDKYLSELVSMRKELVEEFAKLTSPWISKEGVPAVKQATESMSGKGISSESQVKISVKVKPMQPPLVS